MKDYPNTPCHHPQRPSLEVGKINYTAEQINALLELVPLKVGREELNQLISFTSDNFIGHYPDASMLTDQEAFAWAFVGDIAAAVPYFHYMEGYAPKGYAPGWNNMQHIFGTYPLFTDNREDQLTAEELFKIHFRLPELIADRAIADEHGNRLPDTYVTRQGLTEHIKNTYNQQFLENPPLITEGYITPGMLSEETRQMLEATGQEITNLPDGEDLQAVHGVLKFANKQYNPNSYDGLGRQYIRRNVVNGVNTLVQSMIQWSNTLYIIRYDHDLQGRTITIPEGCTLMFESGKFYNGTIILNNTQVRPYGCSIQDYIDCRIEGAYRKGQVLYSEEYKQTVVWTGEKWKCSYSVLFRTYENRLQQSLDDGETWENVSDYIASCFRFVASSSDPNSIGKIQISQDNKNWKDLSPEFTNHLKIADYVATTAQLPSSPALGTIYGVGPDAQSMYQIYVYTSKGWVNNGSFTSVMPEVVQETGDSETKVMSQKSVTEKLSDIGSEVHYATMLLVSREIKVYTFGSAAYKHPIEPSLEEGIEYKFRFELPVVVPYIKIRLIGESGSVTDEDFVIEFYNTSLVEFRTILNYNATAFQTYGIDSSIGEITGAKLTIYYYEGYYKDLFKEELDKVKTNVTSLNNDVNDLKNEVVVIKRRDETLSSFTKAAYHHDLQNILHGGVTYHCKLQLPETIDYLRIRLMDSERVQVEGTETLYFYETDLIEFDVTPIADVSILQTYGVSNVDRIVGAVFSTSYESGTIKDELNKYQEKLVSNENIKTINGLSILGSGDIEIEGGSSAKTQDCYAIRKLIPSYYFAYNDNENTISENENEYLDGKIVEASAFDKHLIFFTDTHWGSYSWTGGDTTGKTQEGISTLLMRYAMVKLEANNVLFGGDLLTSNMSRNKARLNARRFMNNTTSAFGRSMFFMIGNHDLNQVKSSSDYGTDSLLGYRDVKNIYYAHQKGVVTDSALVTKALELGYTGDVLEEIKAFTSTYFYHDDESIKTRYIILNTGSSSSNSAMSELLSSGSLPLQFKFLCKALNDTPEGYDVVVCGHLIISYTTYIVSAANQIRIMKAISAYKSRSQVTFSGYGSSQIAELADISSFDFSTNQKKRGKIFVLCGDTHHDSSCICQTNNGVYESIPYEDGMNYQDDAILVINTISECCGSVGTTPPSTGNATNYPTNSSDWGTVNETAFDIISWSDSEIKAVRVGNGVSRLFKY